MHVFCYLIISFENMKKKNTKGMYILDYLIILRKTKKNACIYYIFWMDNKKKYEIHC